MSLFGLTQHKKIFHRYFNSFSHIFYPFIILFSFIRLTNMTDNGIVSLNLDDANKLTVYLHGRYRKNTLNFILF
jgi:hypothetical protein